MMRVLRHETFSGDHHRCQRAFHIRCAATKQHTVADRRLEWRVDPAIGVASGHHVGMSGKGQRFALSTPGPEITGIAHIHMLNGKANRAQAFNH